MYSLCHWQRHFSMKLSCGTYSANAFCYNNASYNNNSKHPHREIFMTEANALYLLHQLTSASLICEALLPLTLYLQTGMPHTAQAVWGIPV